MKKLSTYIGLMCLALIIPLMAAAQGNVTAEWDWQNHLPEGIKEATNFEGTTGRLESTVAGIFLEVDATNGKLNAASRDNDAQFNEGTILKVPVKTAKDTVTVFGFPGYFHYSIGGVEATEATTSHRATAAEVEQGYVEVKSTGSNSYLYGIKVVHVSMIQEKAIYSTDFNDWTEAKAATSESTVAQKTKYTNETLTFTLYNTAIFSCTDAKFADKTELPHMSLQANKAADPYVTTSTLQQVSRVRYIHGATGSNRGWKLEAKGEGDDDWVVISDAIANPAAWSEVNAEVNRKNVQLRWTNLNAEQNAYMFELDIYSMIDMSTRPALGSFKVNGTTYQVADVFDEQNDGTNTATIEISKKETMISDSNPLTDLDPDNGEVTSTTYEVAEDGKSATVTIVVTAGEETATYKATIVFKPDYTLTYINTDGNTIGTQTVEKDATIEAFAYDVDKVTVADGKKFRGWFVGAEGGRKYTTEEVILGNINLYAVATEIETENPTSRYFFNLTDKYFYDEDHEAFNLTGTGEYHDNQHGWAVYSGDKIDLLVGGHAYIVLGLCKYSNASTITISDKDGNSLWTTDVPASNDGESAAYEYDGEAGTLTITVSNSTVYLHSVTIVNDAEKKIVPNEQNYFVVEAGNADNLLKTLDVANATAKDDARTLIFIPDGTYDLGEACLTPISGNNISLIGQSMDNTIIMNTAPEEGIAISATFLVTGQNTYMQDLTLKNAYDFYQPGNAGRAVCLQDKGNRTICKNVKMLSYQDTYYSNAAKQFYFENSEIHGCVDYICGGGDVFFNKCLLVNESRKADVENGDVTITAPYTDAENTFGYVFDGCTIETLSSTFNYGRAWGGVPRLAFLNTTINQPTKIATSRFTTGGMNVAADKFVEYNTMDANGKVISPASNVLKFTKDSQVNEMETILKDEQAAEYALDKVFPDWTPAASAAQVEMGILTNSDGKLKWDAIEDATAYAIFDGGKLVAIVSAEETQYSSDALASTIEMRAANSMGGFGPAVTTDNPNAISSANETVPTIVKTEYFNLQGMKVTKEFKGTVIKVQSLDNGTKNVTKLNR